MRGSIKFVILSCIAVLLMDKGLIQSVSASLSAVTNTVGFTSAEMQQILDYHNSLRSIDGAGSSSMLSMVWSDALAQTAQAWANACDQVNPHDNMTNRIAGTPFPTAGQNVQRCAPTWTNCPITGLMQFYQEKQDYTLSTNACTGVTSGTCGHYTQVSWATSQYIGCGYNNACPNGGLGKFVCNYGPTGNYVGQGPFIAGTACSACPKAAPFCFNNLCVGTAYCTQSGCVCGMIPATCTGNGGTPNSASCLCTCPAGKAGRNCELACADTAPAANCAYYNSLSLCTNPIYTSLLQGMCPSTCNLCDVSLYSYPVNTAYGLNVNSAASTLQSLGLTSG